MVVRPRLRGFSLCSVCLPPCSVCHIGGEFERRNSALDLRGPGLTVAFAAGNISSVSSPGGRLFAGVSAVLFDLDGTLVETRIDFSGMKGAVLAQAEARGLDPEHLRDLDILAVVETAADRLPEPERDSYRLEAWRMLERFELVEIEKAAPVKDAARSLERLRAARFRLGLITRNCRAAAVRMQALLPRVFDVCLTREDVSRCKPDPLHIKAALEVLHVEAESTVVVGDHRMDIQAGKAAGARTAGVLFAREPGYFDQYGPDAVFTSLQDLTDALINPDR